MAQFKVNKAPAEPVRPYLEGVAKSLVDRLYGPEGPAWGTKLTEIETTLEAVRQVLCESMLDQALQRQADAADARPTPYRCCPKCGKEVELRAKEEDDALRVLHTKMGTGQWFEPEMYCRKCRRSFFPSDDESGDRSVGPESGNGGLRAEDRIAGHVVSGNKRCGARRD